MTQILTLLSLYWEFIACIFAASVLSLVVGWMISRSSVKKRMQDAIKSWEQRYKDLEESSAADTENLEEQLQEIAGELRSLKATNRMLTESLKKHDATIQTARAEAIELNRQHAEMQERLQRVIQQKEQEMASLSGLRSSPTESASSSGSTYTPLAGSSATSGALAGALTSVFSDDADDSLEATLPDNMDTAFSSDALASALGETDLNTADTVAITTTDVLDATVQMSAAEFIHQSKKNAKTVGSDPDSGSGSDSTPGSESDSEFDDFIEETADISGMFMEEMEESTVALDEESLDFAKRPYSVSNAD